MLEREKPKLNLKLFRKVREAILREPKQFLMEFVTLPYNMLPAANVMLSHEQIPNCHTAACFAGWAAAIVRHETPAEVHVRPASAWSTAAKALGVYDDARQWDQWGSCRLFEIHGWPQMYRDRYCEARTFEDRAQAAAERLDYFIQTGV